MSGLMPSLDRDHRAVTEHLDTWETAELLTHEQVESILAFELAEARAPGRRIPLVAEVVGYVGVALVGAAVASVAGRTWNDLSSPTQLVILAVGTFLFLAAGWPIHRSEEPALARLSGLLWTVSVAALFGFMLTLLFARPEVDETATWAVFALGLVVGLYARVLLVQRSSTLLQLALFAGTVTTLVGVGTWAIDDGSDWLDRWGELAVSAMVLAVALVWAAAGRRGLLQPRPTAYTIAALAALWTPLPLMDEWLGAAVLYGVVIAGLVLASGVWLRSVPCLAIGAVGMFVYVTQASVHYLADTAGLPIALLLAGLVFVAIAVVAVRLRRVAVAAARSSEPSEAIGEAPEEKE
jgi:hypothetical protein